MPRSNCELLFSIDCLPLMLIINDLFNHGFISFENAAKLLISPVAHAESIKNGQKDLFCVLMTGLNDLMKGK